MFKMRALLMTVLLFVSSALFVDAKVQSHRKIQREREYWVASMEKICLPVLENLSKGTLRENMPVQTKSLNI